MVACALLAIACVSWIVTSLSAESSLFSNNRYTVGLYDFAPATGGSKEATQLFYANVRSALTAIEQHDLKGSQLTYITRKPHGKTNDDERRHALYWAAKNALSLCGLGSGS